MKEIWKRRADALPNPPQKNTPIAAPLKFLALEDREWLLSCLCSEFRPAECFGQTPVGGMIALGSHASYHSAVPQLGLVYNGRVVINISYQLH